MLVVGETWSKLCVHSVSVLCHWGGKRERQKKALGIEEVKKMKKILLVVAL